jgi:hypothetical protein
MVASVMVAAVMVTAVMVMSVMAAAAMVAAVMMVGNVWIKSWLPQQSARRWVERSDTHQLHLMGIMGFAGSTHPCMGQWKSRGNHRSDLL